MSYVLHKIYSLLKPLTVGPEIHHMTATVSNITLTGTKQLTQFIFQSFFRFPHLCHVQVYEPARVYVPHACVRPQRPELGTGSPGIGVTGSCEACRHWDWTRSSARAGNGLTIHSSLQSLIWGNFKQKGQNICSLPKADEQWRGKDCVKRKTGVCILYSFFINLNLN